MHQLTTPYQENFDKENVWNVYPRPSLKRDSFFSLNGEWDFASTKSEIFPSVYEEKILVPFPPESYLSGINRILDKDEILYYRRSFVLPEGFIKEKVILHFGGVDQSCEVFINGLSIGKNVGGYIPFSFDITDIINSTENEISLKVYDNLSDIYPYGKQKRERGGMWYTEVSGIWQTVWLESVPKEFISNIKIMSHLDSATIQISSPVKEKRLTLLDSNEIFEFEGDCITIKPKEKRAWSPQDPYLYRFRIECGDDSVESYFALREVSIKKVGGVSKIHLNNKPYLFHGLLDQGYFPDGIFLPATYKGFEEDILTAKRLGFNMLRKHIKIEPEIFYYLCDKLGMVVFQDMVNNSDYSFFRDTALPTIGIKRLKDKKMHRNEESRSMFKKHMTDTIQHLYNHPSIVYYTIFNEGWGQFCADDMYALAKSVDNTRIYDSTSGWFFQKDSDVDSHHIYFKKLKAKPNADKPTVISEFGGYSHRCEGHVYSPQNYGYKTFCKQEDFESAFKSLYTEQVLPLVKDGVCAFVYTQLSDVEDETNGLLTYDRRVVKISEELAQSISTKLMEAFLEN